MMLKEKRILITGGAGFIGSNLVEALSPSNDITILDNLRSGKRENLLGDYTFIEGDISDISELNSKEFDVVLHLAAMASVEDSFKNPAECIRINTEGTVKVLEFCRRNGIDRFIFTSTAALYGNDPVLPKKEDMKQEILSPYAASKDASERLVEIYSDVYGLKAYNLRLFNAFGPRQDPKSPYSGVISIFTERAMRDETIYINGDGSNTRDFVYVKDIVNAFICATQGKDKFGSTINIATNTETRIDDLANMLITKLDSKSEIVYREPRVGDVYRSYADNTLAREILGWEPNYSVDEGLNLYLEWLKSD